MSITLTINFLYFLIYFATAPIYTKLCIVPILVINNYCCPEKIMKRFKNNISPDSREYPFKRDL